MIEQDDDYEISPRMERDLDYKSPNDELELKKRQEIVSRFNNASFDSDVRFLIDTCNNAEYGEFAFKHRIGLNNDDFHNFFQTLMDINEHLAMCQSILDSYITFSNSTPNFQNLQNAIFHFYDFIAKQSSRTFYFVMLEKYGIHYFEAGTFKKHVYGLSFLLSRLKGTLAVASWYIIDIESQTRQSNSGGFDRFGGSGGFDRFGGNNFGSGAYGNYGNSYGNYNPAYNNIGVNRTTTNIKIHRDIGDAND
jgi:hypothetical protein